MTRLMRLASCALALAAAITVGSCEDPARTAACETVCNRYHDCLDGNYDTAHCTSRCRDNSANDTTFQDQIDHCNACIQNRACTDAVVRCTVECVGIVP